VTPERWAQLKQIFVVALEQSGEERAAFLARSCAGLPDLRAEVERLLSSGESSRGILDSPTASREDDDLVPESRSRPLRAGPYEIVREVGHGGMGVVYFATRSDEVYRKEVAIKIVRRGMDTEFVLSRFRTERQILAALVHPNIAALLDGGTTGDGLPYFVMEYVEGEAIDQYCDARRLSISERLDLFLAVCGAVEYAHANLVVHRDLKPGNILVKQDGCPKLLDFGLAKLLDPGSPLFDQTATQHRFLTPAFASPEQIRGDPISTATDVYSLGVLLYHLLTGHRPYQTPGASFHELARAVCEEETLKPSRVAFTGVESSAREGTPEKLRRRLSGDLDTIILKAMAKQPERRYGSVERFAGDIRRHLEGRPVLARPNSVLYRTGKFVSRHWGGLVATALIVFSLGGAFIETGRQRARAERRFNDVRKLANHFLFEFHDAIKNLPGSTKARVLVVKRAQEYLDGLASEAAGDAALQQELASAYQTLAELQGGQSGSDPAAAATTLQKALAIRRALAARQHDRDSSLALAGTINSLAAVRLHLGDSAGSVSLSQQALSIVEPLAPAGPDIARAKLLSVSYHFIGDALTDQGKYREALEYHRKAMELFEKLAAADPKDLQDPPGAPSPPEVQPSRNAQRNLALSYKYVGALLEVTGDGARAAPLYRKAIALDAARVEAEATNAQAKLDLSFSYGALAQNLLDAGDLAGALEYHRKALPLREQVAAADPANAWARSGVARSHQSIGFVLMRMGEPAHAVASVLKALTVFEEMARDNPLDLGKRSRLGQVYAELGADEIDVARDSRTPRARRSLHWRQARSWYLKSEEIRRQLLGKPVAPHDAIDSQRNATQIALCDAALAQFTAGNSPAPGAR
jgi:non-specific serine/threonine protein kinase/serine/threonine-protein kinase